ncbi:MAG TPA: hypothetical protein VF071_05325 [Candidatus Limnocylindria bacterium]
MTHTNDSDRGRKLTPTRRALAVAGAATLAFSLVLSIGPVLAAAGTLKVHDAATGLEVSNRAHVCSFFVAFHGSDPELVGTWDLLSWPPGGDGSVVDSGPFDTSGDGVDVTGTLSPAPGHYRIRWSASNDTKTFWVDADCTEETNSEPSGDGSSDPSPSSGTDPSHQADPSDDASPSSDPSPSSGTDPSHQADPSDDASPSSDPSPSTDPSQGVDPSNEANASSDPDPSTAADPSDDPAPSQDVAPVDEENSGQVEQDVQAGNPTGGSGSLLPDTALPINESGVLATIGILLILAAHVGTRRERQLPAA